MSAGGAATRGFAKRWGCEFCGPGEAVFRLWAPGQERLALRMNGRDHGMQRQDNGWFEQRLTQVAPDTPYCFVLDDGLAVPDPASRAQRDGVNGPSLAVDPHSWRWRNPGWRGRPWEEAVIYEMHVGTFTPQGTFQAAAEKLPYLAQLGITAVEVMPVAQFAGQRGWGYDGVLPYAPHNAYGSPDDFKHLIDTAHGLGLMVLLDVVYNHFGPEGNYLSHYAPAFFHPEQHTPWGAAIAYEREPVRQFFIDNAIYWLEEYFLDGLRLDAIDHVRDDESDPELLVEIAQAVRERITDRQVHLTTEDNRNITRLHERDGDGNAKLYTAEWNDDFHNVAHLIATGEAEGYYADFAEDHWRKLSRCLAEGFAYQGEISRHGGGKPRGEASSHLPPQAFVDFLQNHDQTGNRAFGERLLDLAPTEMVRCLTAVLLLSPHVPLLFMGEEFGETRPFCFFTDFHGELADAVREGRRREFAGFAAFAGSPGSVSRIPDPNAPSTFEASKLDWGKTQGSEGRAWLGFFGDLLRLRHEHIVPALGGAGGHCGRIAAEQDGLVAVEWRLGRHLLELRANLTDRTRTAPRVSGTPIFDLAGTAGAALRDGGELPAWSVLFAMAAANGADR